jgi:hypothetical protein
MSSRPASSSEQVSVQLGLHGKTLSPKNKKSQIDSSMKTPFSTFPSFHIHNCELGTIEIF